VKEMMINEPSSMVHCSLVTIAYPVFCFEYSGTKDYRVSTVHALQAVRFQTRKIYHVLGAKGNH
jgi:hypothetical protein